MELNPTYAKAYNNRGIVYAITGDYQKAMEDFNAAISINNMDSTAFYNRGQVYKRLGKLKEADKDFQTVARLKQKQAQN